VYGEATIYHATILGQDDDVGAADFDVYLNSILHGSVKLVDDDYPANFWMMPKSKATEDYSLLGCVGNDADWYPLVAGNGVDISPSVTGIVISMDNADMQLVNVLYDIQLNTSSSTPILEVRFIDIYVPAYEPATPFEGVLGWITTECTPP
jgi:hypothetical protein